MAVVRILQDTPRPGKVTLTRTEQKVLSYIAKGYSSKEVADYLTVSKRTIDFHLANIYDKLQVRNRVQALRSAASLGLLPPDSTYN